MASLTAKAPDGNTLTIDVPQGTDPSSYGSLVDDAMKHYASVSKAAPQLNSPFQPSSAQEKQYPISSLISKGLGAGAEIAMAPLDVVGESMRVAGEGAPAGKTIPFLPKLATAKDPTGFRAPTIIQRISGMLPQPNALGIPNMITPEAPPNPFVKAYQGLEGLTQAAPAVAQAVRQGGDPATVSGDASAPLQQASSTVTGKPDLAANLGGMALGLGTGEAGNSPFTAAIKPFTAIGKLMETGELAGIPGTGLAGKAASGLDALPLGLENLTAPVNQEIMAAATQNKVPITPGMATGSPTLNAIESFGKKMPFMSNIFQKRFGAIYDAMENMHSPIVETAKPPADLGLDIQQGFSTASNANMGKAKALYANAESTLPQGAQIPILPLKSAASDLAAAQGKLPPGARAAGAGQILSDLADPKGPQTMDYPTLQALRSELGSRITQANAALKSATPGASFQSSPEVRMFSKLKDAVDQSLNNFSEKTGGAFKSAYSEATKTYQAYKQTYADDKFVQSILNEQNPEKVVDKVVAAAKNNPRALGTLKLNLPTETLNNLQTYFIKDVTEKVPNVFSPSHFASQYDSIGEKRLTDILGPDKMAELRPLYILSKAGVNAEKSGQAASGPSGAGMNSAMMLRQPIQALITGLAGGKLIGGSLKAAALGGAMMEGLPLMAKGYLSSPVGKLLTRQMGTPAALSAMGQMAPVAAKIGGPVNAIAQNPQSRDVLMQVLQRLLASKGANAQAPAQ